MKSTDSVNQNFGFLILGSSTSFILYIIEIKDWLLPYEIFLDIPLGFISICSLGLFVLLIVEIIQKKILPNVVLLVAFFALAITYFGIYAQRNGLFWKVKMNAPLSMISAGWI